MKKLAKDKDKLYVPKSISKGYGYGKQKQNLVTSRMQGAEEKRRIKEKSLEVKTEVVQVT